MMKSTIIIAITIAIVCMIFPTQACQSSASPFKVVIKNNYNICGLVFRVDDPENTLIIEKVKSGSTWIFDTYTQTKWGIVSGDFQRFTQFEVGKAPVDKSDKTLNADQLEWRTIDQIPFKFQKSTCSDN